MRIRGSAAVLCVRFFLVGDTLLARFLSLCFFTVHIDMQLNNRPCLDGYNTISMSSLSPIECKQS